MAEAGTAYPGSMNKKSACRTADGNHLPTGN